MVKAMTDETPNNEAECEDAWPAVPEAWPPVFTDIEAAQYLKIDHGRNIESAKRTLRFLRVNRGLPSPGRIAGKVLYRKEAIDEWLKQKEEMEADRIRDGREGGEEE